MSETNNGAIWSARFSPMGLSKIIPPLRKDEINTAPEELFEKSFHACNKTII
jgi:hypothetical protein